MPVESGDPWYCPPEFSYEQCYGGWPGGAPIFGGGIGSGGGGVIPESDFLPKGATDAKSTARSDLSKVNCWKDLGFASAAAAQAKFDALRFVDVHQGPLQLGRNGRPLTTPASTSGFGTIYINSDYNWDDFSKTAKQGGGTYDYLAWNNSLFGTSMTSDQLATLIIVHEISHNAPRPVDAPDPTDTRAMNLSIYNDCVK